MQVLVSRITSLFLCLHQLKNRSANSIAPLAILQNNDSCRVQTPLQKFVFFHIFIYSIYYKICAKRAFVCSHDDCLIKEDTPSFLRLIAHMEPKHGPWIQVHLNWDLLNTIFLASRVWIKMKPSRAGSPRGPWPHYRAFHFNLATFFVSIFWYLPCDFTFQSSDFFLVYF